MIVDNYSKTKGLTMTITPATQNGSKVSYEILEIAEEFDY